MAGAATGRLAFDPAVAEPWGRFKPVAELQVGPPGALNRLRDDAYPLSQRAWALTGSAAEQVAAEEVREAPARPLMPAAGDGRPEA